MIGRSIVLGLTIVGLAACAAGIALRRSAPCVGGNWSAPEQLTLGTGGLVHVETPQMVATKRGVVFFGNNALVLTVGDSGFGRVAGWPRGPGMLAGVLRLPDGHLEPVALPHEQRSFVSVRAVGDAAGNAHVFWGHSSDTTADQDEHVQGVMYARFDGYRWSEPEHVLADSTMSWSVIYSAIAATRDGNINVVVPNHNFPDQTTTHIRRTAAGQWIVTRPPLRAYYATLATGVDGTLWLGYIRSGSPSDRAAVSIVRSTDGGATWSTPRDIRRTGRGDAFALRLVPIDRALYALWESSPPLPPSDEPALVTPPERHDSLQAAISRDSGFTWTRLPGLSVPAGVGGLEAIAGPDRAVHALFQTRVDTTQVIAAAVLRDSTWTGPAIIAPGPFWPTISSQGDSLLVSWDDWVTAGPERAPLSKLSVWRCSGGL